MGSPIWALFESPSGSTGRFFALTLSSARSRPDISPPATGGLYFFTSACSRVPLDRTTNTAGSILADAVGSAVWTDRWAAVVPAGRKSSRAIRTARARTSVKSLMGRILYRPRVGGKFTEKRRPQGATPSGAYAVRDRAARRYFFSRAIAASA